MSISPARLAAYRTLLDVERRRGFAAELLDSSEKRLRLSADRRLATEIVLGTLRWRGELDYHIERLTLRNLHSLDVEVLTALRMGLYQLRFLSKVPPSAIVNEAVELVKRAQKRSAAGLVNAVLRKASSLPGTITETENEQAIQRAYPEWLIERWRKQYGESGARALARAGVQTPLTALRILGLPEKLPLIQEELAGQGLRTRVGAFSPTALVVESGHLAEIANLSSARVIVQDEASQLIVPLLAVKPGERVLDLAAAPGIKASQIASEMERGFLVVADRSARRLQMAKQLWPRLCDRGPSPRWVRLDATQPLPFAGSFDRILADVPCSGTGTLSRNPEIKWRLREQDLARLADMQCRVLRNALGLLRRGGRLVYSTCSLEREENEGVVETVLSELDNFRLEDRSQLLKEFPALASLFDVRGYFRTRPDLHPMDGFFGAVITRG